MTVGHYRRQVMGDALKELGFRISNGDVYSGNSSSELPCAHLNSKGLQLMNGENPAVNLYHGILKAIFRERGPDVNGLVTLVGLG